MLSVIVHYRASKYKLQLVIKQGQDISDITLDAFKIFLKSRPLCLQHGHNNKNYFLDKQELTTPDTNLRVLTSFHLD